MSGEWLPIETAPKDGSEILVYMGGKVRIASFDQEKYHKNPKPFWNSSLMGVRWCRESQPDHWMPLPEPPTEEKRQSVFDVYDTTLD